MQLQDFQVLVFMVQVTTVVLIYLWWFDMPVNINGYNLSNSSGLAFGSSQSRIRSSGAIGAPLAPFTPGVFGSKIGVGSQSQYPWVLNSTTFNAGTVWTSNTTFTCPVAGAYYTSWNSICQGSQSTTPTTTLAGYGGLVKNGVLQGFFHWATNDAWDTVNYNRVVICAAGDTLTWAINIAPSPVGSSPGAYGDNHNMSTIWFIG
jgi:hypothetical protein